mgnify:CR=1 FL=1
MASLGEILGLQSFQDRRAQGGPQDVANRRRKEQQENALAQLLNQQNVDQNNANLRGTQLQNTQRAREMARQPQNKFERLTGQDGYQYQVETGPNGRQIGVPTRIDGLGQSAPDPYKRAQTANIQSQIAERARLANAPKALSPLQLKIELEGGKPYAEMTGQERKAAFQKVNAPKASKPTADQGKAAGFYDRMIASQGELDSLPKDFDPVSFYETAKSSFNTTTSSDKQRYTQAQEDWVRAKLRKESGAVIGEEEMEGEVDIYFPRYGDGEEVIAQKQRARKVAERAMMKMSGQTVGDGGQPMIPGVRSIKVRGPSE